MPLNKSEIKKILIISLSNIGDVILTFPAMDIIRHQFDQSYIKIIVGPKAVGLLKNNPYFQAVDSYNKQQPIKKTIVWVGTLLNERYDLVIDFRNTAIPLFIFPKYRSVMGAPKKFNSHMREKHLLKLKTIYHYPTESSRQYSLFISEEDKQVVKNLFLSQLDENSSYIVVAPGAANSDKRWNEERFAVVCDEIVKKYNKQIVFVGDWEDKKISCRIIEMMEKNPINLCGETSLPQMGEIIRRAYMAIVNDSAPMHMASYLNVPTLAIFGPSNPAHYGPWNQQHIVLHDNKDCRKCLKPDINELHTCMVAISVDEVLLGVNNLMKMID